MAGQQATLDISARITGYQASLQQMRKAIDQIDPGSVMGKSLQKMFKQAQDYINQLAKKPIVNVSSDSQISKLNTSLQHASSLINNIAQGFSTLSIGDMNVNALDEATKELKAMQSQLEKNKETIEKELTLEKIAGEATGLNQIFNKIGQKVDDLSASQGLKILQDRLEESRTAGEALTKQLEQAKQRVKQLKAQPVKGFFGKEVNSKTRSDVLETVNIEKNPINNINFNTQAFSKEAIENLKKTLQANLANAPDAMKSAFSKFFDESFNKGITNLNLQSTIKEFVGKISEQLNSVQGADVKMPDIFGQLFGTNTRGNPISDAVQAFTKVAGEMRSLTVESSDAAVNLKLVVETLAAVKSITDKKKIQLFEDINANKLKEVQAILHDIIQKQQKLNEPHVKKIQQAERNRNSLAQKVGANNRQTAELDKFTQALQNTSSWQQAQNKIASLQKQITELKEKLEQANNAAVKNTKDMATGAGQAANEFKLTTEEVKKLQAQANQLKEVNALVGKMQGILTRWFGIYAVINKVTRAIKSMISTVQQLDKTITNIAIVTDMSQNDLWAAMPTYTKMAREYAASISGVYEVSQLYYQQGLQTVDVMKLTQSTLKMARISGLDYAESTDYMTNALRSFKMQMQDAENIVNVYSAIAASSATNVSQLAQAMSKTASSAQAVGSSFENTTAMMAVMIEATRQAPENIGSAMKSIISRYGELKTNPAALVDAEGEELSLNKVDTALQSVGISIHNAQGEFRNFDEVILQLAESWDTIDVNTQRYIATIMAGNRQQSRFLALVSSGERLKELMGTATDSENAAQLQYLKTLDSVEAKQQQMKTSLQSIYLDTGIEEMYKGMLDIGTQVINTFLEIPRIGKLPIPAIVKLGTTFMNVAKLVTAGFTAALTTIQAKLKENQLKMQAAIKQTGNIQISEAQKVAAQQLQTAKQLSEQKKAIWQQELQAFKNAENLKAKAAQASAIMQNHKQGTAMTLTALGTGATLLGAGMQNGTAKTGITAAGGVLSGVGSILMGGAMGKIMGTIQLITTGIELLGNMIETTEEKIERFDKAIDDANNKKLQTSDQLKTLTDYAKKYEQLKKHQDESNEAKEEFIALNAQIAAKYPELISKIDSEGNLIVQLGDAYERLKQKKKDAYDDSFIDYWEKKFKAFYDQDFLASKIGVNLNELANTQLGKTAEKIKNKTKAQQVADQTIIEALRSQLDIIKSLATESKDMTDEYSISKEGYTELRNKLLQYINFSTEQFDIAVGMIEEQNGQITFDGIELAKKFDAAMDSYLTMHSQATFKEWVQIWNLTDSVNTEQITSAVQYVNSYEETLQKNLITSMVADVRKIYDTIFDPKGALNNLSGSFINNELINSAKVAIENADDPSTAFKNWASSTLPKLYTQLLKQTQENNILFSALNKYYENLEQLSNSQYLKLQSQYKDTKVWSTFKKEYQQLQTQADNALLNAGFGGSQFRDMSASIQKRIAALSAKNNFNASTFSKYFADSTSKQMQIILPILQANSLDTISGIESALDQYAKTSGIERGTKAWNDDQFVRLMQEFENSVKINFNTEYQTLTQSYTKNLKEFDKALKNATQGMGFEDAVALANKLGKTLADFRRVGEKWYYDNIEDITTKFMPGNDQLRQVLENYSTQIGDEAFGTARFSALNQKYREEYSAEQFNKLTEEEQRNYTAIQGFKSWAQANGNKALTRANWDLYIQTMQQNFDQLDKAQQDLKRSHLLEIGKISEFLDEFDLDNTNISSDNLYQKALAGQLTGDLAKYQQQLIEYYQKSTKSVYDAAEKLLKGEVGGVAITVTDANDELLSKLTGTEVKFDSNDLSKTVVLTAQQINENWQAWLSYLNDGGEYTAEEIAEIQKLYKAKEKPSIFNSLKTAIGSYKQIDVTTYYNIPQTIRERIIQFNQETGKGILNFQELVTLLADDAQLFALGMTEDQVRQLHVIADQATAKIDNNLIVQTLVKNHQSLKEQNIQQIAKLLNISYDAAKSQLVSNGDGTYRIDLSKLQELIEAGGIKLTQATQDLIESTIEKQLQDAQKLISNMKDGFTSTDQMQKIVDLINKSTEKYGTDEAKTINDFYEYNTALHAWVLTRDGLSQYLEAINKAINETDDNEVKKGLQDQKLQTLLKNNKLDEFLKEIGIIYPAYADAIKTAIDKGDYTELPKQLYTYIDEFLELRKDATGQLINNMENAANSWNKQAFIKYEDLGGKDNVSEYLNKYGEILKDTGDGLLIDLAHTSVNEAQAMLVALYKQQGLAAGEAADKALSVVQNLVHSPVEDAIKVMQNIKGAAGGTNYSTALQLQAEFKALGGNGKLMKWNDVLEGYVYDAEQLKDFIALLKTKGNIAEFGVTLQQINTELIKSGQLDSFLDISGLRKALIEQDTGNFIGYQGIQSASELIEKFHNGEQIEGLTADYYEALAEYLQNGSKEIIDGATSLLNGTAARTSVKVTAGNKAILAELTGKTDLVEGAIVQYGINTIKSHMSSIIQLIQSDPDMGRNEKDKQIASIWEAYFTDANFYDAIKGVIDNPTDFDISAYQKLPKAMQKLATINKITGKFSIDINQITDEAFKEANLTLQQTNEIKAKLAQSKREKSAANVLSEIVKNSTSLSEDNLKSLANLLKQDYDQIRKLVEQNSDGSFTMNLTTLRKLISDKNLELNTAIQNSIAELIDHAIDMVSSAASGQQSGYTKFADMQKIMSDLQDAGFSYDFDKLFKWDATLKAYVSTTQGLFAQMALARQQLQGATQEERKVAEQLIQGIGQRFREKIDFSSLYSATTSRDLDQQTIDDLQKAINDYNQYLVANGKEVKNYQDQINKILAGGQQGVQAAQELAAELNQKLSNSDIEAIYTKRSKALLEAMNQITAKPGAIVDDLTGRLIRESGGKVQLLANGSYKVIQSATNLYQTYLGIYEHLKNSGTATLEELNNIVAKAYEAKDQAELTSLMSGLTDITYSALANIFTAVNEQMTPTLLNNLFKTGSLTALGAGKIRINDFEQFTRAMGVDPTSQDYYKAFSAFNDQMINLNKQAADNIRNAANGILNAKTGDQINLTELYTHLSDKAWTAFEQEINKAGGSLNQGILTIDNTKNLTGIYQAIMKVGYEAGKLVEEDYIEVQKALMAHKREINLDAVVQNIASNADQLTEDNVEQLAKALGISFNQALKYFAQGKNGYFRIDAAHLTQAIAGKGVSVETSNAIENMVSSIIEEANSLLNDVSNIIVSGFGNLSEVKTLVQQLNKNSDHKIELEDIAYYNTELNRWMLRNTGIRMQMQLAAAQLKKAGYTDEQVTNELISMRQQLAESIDIMNYVGASDKKAARLDLSIAIANFNAASEAFVGNVGININQLTDAMDQGGIAAVQALSQFASITKQKFTSEDYLTVFNQGANKITKALEEMNVSVGSVISKESAEILGMSNISEIEKTGQVLVTEVVDMVNAYQVILNKMRDSTGKIRQGFALSDINQAIVDKYTAEFGSQQLISEAGNGSISMSSFKQAMDRMGYFVDDMLTAMIDGEIAQYDQQTGNIKILDFDKFIEILDISKWDENGQLTQAYKDAYKSWNDTIIERTTKNANAIKSQLDSLINAQAGDYLNISTIWNKIGQDRQGLVAASLEKLGVEVNNGILFITQHAKDNIVPVIRGITAEAGIYNTKKGNELMASAYKQQREASVDSLYLSILQSRQSLNEDNIKSIADTFGYTYDSVAKWLEGTKQGDGTYKLSVADVKALFEGRGVSDQAKKVGEKIIGSILDNVLSNLSGLSNKTFNLQQVSKLTQDLNTKTTKTFSGNELFTFNKELGGYVLTTAGIYAQFRTAALQAKDNKQAMKLLKTQAKSFIEGINISDVVEGLQGNTREKFDTKKQITQAIQKYNAARTALGKSGLNPAVLLENLAEGGQKAVAAARAIASAQGTTLSDSEITNIYRSKVQKLMDASEELMSAGVGDIISKTTADLIGYTKASEQRLTIGGDAVLQSAINLVDAYTKLYKELQDTGAATLFELNEVMTNILGAQFEASNGTNKGFQYLEKAAGLSYKEFGEMFAEAGVLLTEDIFSELKNKNIISEIGGGLIRVEDFNFIAKKLGLQQGSEEYTKAFKAYNDALIELDNKVTDNIVDEVSSIAEARVGKRSKVNLTQLFTEADKLTLYVLQDTLKHYGGVLHNGILTIEENANIPALIQNIIDIGKRRGILLQQEVANLADTLNELIEEFAGTIADAISGGLNNTDAYTLKTQAKNWLGIDINFTKTYEGLKLSNDEATKLYMALKQIDGAAANTVFTELKDSLTGAHEPLQDASDVVAEIARLEAELKKPINANNEELKRRLELYKEIKGAQLDSAESYDFMGKALPEGMQGFENYENSWGKAFKILNEASVNATKELNQGQVRKDSTIGIQDFYNMVNELNNMAAISGEIEFLGMKLDGSLETASKLIEEGYSHITNIDGEGAAINLTQWGVDFASGAEGMAKGVDKGIKQMAQSQIKMLDGLIQMLETVVAMENFKDLDSTGDGSFGLTELFQQMSEGWESTEKAQQAAAKVIEKANSKGGEDLKKGLETVSVNGKSLFKIMEDISKGIPLAKEDAQAYTAALSALYKQLQSGDYDLDNLYASIMQIAKSSEEMTEIELGDKKFLIGRNVQFTWDTEKGGYVAPDGTFLGKDTKQAWQNWQKKQRAETIDAIMKGQSAKDAEFELQDKRKVNVSGGQVLVADENGMYYVGGKSFNSPDKAFAELQKGAKWDISKDLEHIQTWQENNVQYASVNGITWQLKDGQWVDAQERKYGSGQKGLQAAVRAAALEAQLAWTGINFDSFNVDKDKVSGHIKFGVGIDVEIDSDGKPVYYVGKEKTKKTTLKDAQEEAKTQLYDGLKKAHDDKTLINDDYALLLEAGLITLIDPKNNDGNRYLYNGKKFKTKSELTDYINSTLFKDGEFHPEALQQELEIQPALIYDKKKLQEKAKSLTTSEQQQLQNILAEGDKQKIKALLKDQYQVDIEWKTGEEGQISMQQLRELSDALNIDFDTRSIILTAIVNDEDKGIVDLLTTPQTKPIDKYINVIAKWDQENSDKTALETVQGEHNTSQATTPIDPNLKDQNERQKLLTDIEPPETHTYSQSSRQLLQESVSNQEFDRVSKELENIRTSLVITQQKLDDAESKLKQKQNEIEQLKQQLKTNSNNNEIIQNQQQQISSLTQQLVASKSELTTMQQQLEAAQKRLADVQAELVDNLEQNVALQQKNTSLTDIIEKLNSELTDLNDQISIKEQNITLLTSQLESAQETITQLKEQLALATQNQPVLAQAAETLSNAQQHSEELGADTDTIGRMVGDVIAGLKFDGTDNEQQTQAIFNKINDVASKSVKIVNANQVRRELRSKAQALDKLQINSGLNNPIVSGKISAFIQSLEDENITLDELTASYQELEKSIIASTSLYKYQQDGRKRTDAIKKQQQAEQRAARQAAIQAETDRVNELHSAKGAADSKFGKLVTSFDTYGLDTKDLYEAYEAVNTALNKMSNTESLTPERAAAIDQYGEAIENLNAIIQQSHPLLRAAIKEDQAELLMAQKAQEETQKSFKELWDQYQQTLGNDTRYGYVKNHGATQEELNTITELAAQFASASTIEEAQKALQKYNKEINEAYKRILETERKGEADEQHTAQVEAQAEVFAAQKAAEKAAAQQRAQYIEFGKQYFKQNPYKYDFILTDDDYEEVGKRVQKTSTQIGTSDDKYSLKAGLNIFDLLPEWRDRATAQLQAEEQAQKEFSNREKLFTELDQRMTLAGIDHTPGSDNATLWKLYSHLDQLFPDNPNDPNNNWTEFDELYQQISDKVPSLEELLKEIADNTSDDRAPDQPLGTGENTQSIGNNIGSTNTQTLLTNTDIQKLQEATSQLMGKFSAEQIDSNSLLTKLNNLIEVLNNPDPFNQNQQDDSTVESYNELLRTLQAALNGDDSFFQGAGISSDEVKEFADAANEAAKATKDGEDAMLLITTAIQNLPDPTPQLEESGNAASNAANNMQRAGAEAQTASGIFSRVANGTSHIAGTLASIPQEFGILFRFGTQGTTAVKGTINNIPFATGMPAEFRYGFAAAAKGGQAYAMGKTLMGQLGPELVVSNGRYFVVGQAGAEMVSLPKDAIIFNHKQTQNLLKHEKNGGRGKPVTNEKNAISFAKGTGPAAASASQALAALKQIRAMWQSMLGASMKDLGSLAGLEAGKASSKSGGGGGSENDPEQIRAVIEEIERWYNLLRQIDKLQKDITYQETLQAEIESDRVANGQALYKSLKQEIKYLDEEIIRNQQLADLQKSWYERKRNELAESDYGMIFTYNEEGQLQYKDGRNRGLDILEKLTERDIYGQATGYAANAVSQIDYLRSIGFDVDKLKYNDDGTILDEFSDKYKDNPDQIYEAMMENFWNNLDGWKDQLDGIYDSYHDQLNNVLSNETKRNQLLQKIIDNQLSVEQDVLHAIQSRQQKLIDELQDERDALEKSTKNFIDGLNEQLNREKQMYQNNEADKQLVKLRRQVAILQRSGGSASQIRSLQDQIAAKEQDQYFSAQQQQIAAIQKASDLQIQRMDSQIDLMTETLKYQKENGLLWQEVYQIMNSTPQQIRQFITENTPDFQSASALDVAEKIRDIDLRINEWVGYRDDESAPAMTGDVYYDWDSYSAARNAIYKGRADSELMDEAKAEFDRVLNETGDINAAGKAADAILGAVLGAITPEQIQDYAESIAAGINTNGNASVVDKVRNALASGSGNRIISSGSSGVNVQKYINDAWENSKKTTNSTSSTKFTFGASSMKSTSELRQQADILADAFTNPNLTQSDKINLRNEFNDILKKLGKVNYGARYDNIPAYASGGLVTNTGLVQVDGTPSRPEAFLNAQQTELLRSHLFGSSDSLLSLARDIVQQLHGSSYNSTTLNKEDNNGVNIQNVDVNVNVKQIANDYDVRAIGNTVMDEMLKIARKSGTRGINRR